MLGLSDIWPLLNFFAQQSNDPTTSVEAARRQTTAGPRTATAFGVGADRDTQTYGRGQADLTLANLAKAINFGLGIASPLGPLKLGGKLALGELLGKENPMGIPEFSGFQGPNPAGRMAVAGGQVSAQQQFAADRAAAEMRDALMHAGHGSLGGGYGDHGGISLGRDSSAHQAGTTGAPGVY